MAGHADPGAAGKRRAGCRVAGEPAARRTGSPETTQQPRPGQPGYRATASSLLSSQALTDIGEQGSSQPFCRKLFLNTFLRGLRTTLAQIRRIDHLPDTLGQLVNIAGRMQQTGL